MYLKSERTAGSDETWLDWDPDLAPDHRLVARTCWVLTFSRKIVWHFRLLSSFSSLFGLTTFSGFRKINKGQKVDIFSLPSSKNDETKITAFGWSLLHLEITEKLSRCNNNKVQDSQGCHTSTYMNLKIRKEVSWVLLIKDSSEDWYQESPPRSNRINSVLSWISTISKRKAQRLCVSGVSGCVDFRENLWTFYLCNSVNF